jgi:hypothetical protein
MNSQQTNLSTSQNQDPVPAAVLAEPPPSLDGDALEPAQNGSEPIQEVADITAADAQLIKRAKAHLVKAEAASEKAQQHFVALSQCLKELRVGKDQAAFLELVRERIGLGKSRTYELLAIADGTKTAEEVRASGAERKAKQRLSVTSRTGGGGRDGDAPAPKPTSEGNGVDVDASAERMKQAFAEADGGTPAAASESAVIDSAVSEPKPKPTKAENAAVVFEAMWEQATPEMRKGMFVAVSDAELLTEVKRRKLLPGHDAKLTRLLRSGLSVLRQANGDKAAARQKAAAKLAELNALMGERKLGVGDIEIFAS